MKDKKEQLSEIMQDPKKKAIVFFGGYVIFFILVIFFLRSVHNPIDPEGYEMGSSITYNEQSFLKDNYSYTYNIVLDGKEYKYTGKKNNHDELFTYNDKEYYKNFDNYFVNEGVWVKSENPFIFSDFFYSESMVNLIKYSFFESKTLYEDGKTTYNLLVSTNTINKLLHNEDSDFDEVPNKLLVTIDENRNIKEISMELNSYCILNKKCEKSLNINMKYDNYSEIDKIDSPINS